MHTPPHDPAIDEVPEGDPLPAVSPQTAFADTMPAQAPAAPLESRSFLPRLYTVGTLTYTMPALIILFFWLLFGDFALAMRERSVPDVVQVMLKQHAVSDTTVSVLMTALPALISMVIAPIISFRSDRFRSRFGRRIPFLLIPTPVAVTGMVGLALTPRLGMWMDHALGASSPGYNNCVVIFFAFFWTLFEVAALTVGPIFGGLINDVVPRAFLGRFYGLFRVVSLLAGMLVGALILKRAETHLFAIFTSIGLLFGVGFTVMCFRVKEGSYPPPEENPADLRAIGFFGSARIYLRECFRHPYYLWVYCAMLLAGLTFTPFNGFSLYYAKSLHISLETYGWMRSGSYFVSLILAYPLGFLVDKFHSLRVGLAALILYAVSVLYGSFFVHDTPTFGVAFVAHTILSGTYFTASASLGQALFPKHKFGQFASAAGILTSLSNIGMGLTLGPILDFSNHNYRITFILGLIICLAAIVCMLVVYYRFVKLGGPTGYVAPDANATLGEDPV